MPACSQMRRYDKSDPADVTRMTLKYIEWTHFSSKVASLPMPAATAATEAAAQHSQWEEGALADCSRFAAERETGSARGCGGCR